MRTVPLKDVAVINMGTAPPGSSYNTSGEGVPMIAGAGDYGEIYPEPKKWTTQPTRLADPGDLIVCVRATIGDINWADKQYCLGRGVAGLRPRNGRLNVRYLAHFISSQKEALTSLGTGSTFLAIRKGDLENLPIAVPPIPEQVRIAEMLDKADAIRRKLADRLAITDELLAAAFHDMFGDSVTNPKGWDECELGTLLSFMTSGSRGWAKYYTDSGKLFLRIQNVGKNKLVLADTARVTPPDNAESRRTRVKPRDVLFSITADLGRTAVVPDDMGEAHINQHLALLRTESVNPYYLSAFLASQGGQMQVTSLNRNGVKAGLNFNDIRSIRVLLPSRSLQDEYETVYRRHKALETKYVRAHVDAANLFLSLRHRAFQEGL